MNATEWITRVRKMESAELWFRARVAARSQADLLVSTVRTESWHRERLADRLVTTAGFLATARERLEARDWPAAHTALARHFHTRQSRFPLSPDMLPALAHSVREKFPCAADDARARGKRLTSGRFDLLGYPDLSFASETRGPHSIDWHFDPVHRRRSARGFWSKVRYLDSANGDHKIIWELNRHQHWLALGRAAWLTGDRTYRDEFVRQLEDWLHENPPLAGINWASTLELSFRCLSWLWALHLFVEPPAGPGDDPDGAPWMVDLLLGLDRQLAQVEQNLSRYFSPNTHLTGEALGLYVCGIALPELAGASRWTAIGRDVLLDQIDRQICEDGGHAERSTHYHRYTLDFYLLALIAARLTDDPCADRLAEAVRRLAHAARLLADDAGRLPLIGDDDGGMLFPICGREPSDVRDSLATAAVLLDDPRLAPGTVPEETWWMTGAGAVTRRTPLGHRGAGSRVAPPRAHSDALPATGYYVSRRRPGDHLVIDGGPHGYLNGGHAHADALSVTLTLTGEPLFLDPGTATYTMSAEMRDRFRSSAMHNTLTLDGRSQSEPGGPFHWRSAANARVHRWLAAAPFDYFEGTHDGYLPLVHRRRVVVLDGGVVVVVDTVAGDGVHDVAVHWHAAPGWSVEAGASHTLSLGHESGASAWLTTTAATLDVFDGDDQPGLGWTSPTYGRILPSMTLRASVRRALPAAVVTVIGEGFEPDALAVSLRSGETDPGVGGVACRLAGRASSRLLLFSASETPGTGLVRADGFSTDGRFTVIDQQQDGRVTRVALLDGSHVSALAGARDLVRLDAVVDGAHVEDFPAEE